MGIHKDIPIKKVIRRLPVMFPPRYVIASHKILYMDKHNNHTVSIIIMVKIILQLFMTKYPQYLLIFLLGITFFVDLCVIHSQIKLYKNVRQPYR